MKVRDNSGVRAKVRCIADNRVAAVVAGGAVIAVLGASAGFAAGQIDSSDIKNNSIMSKDIKDRTIKGRDLRPALIQKLKGQTGPQGDQGDQGPAGDDAVTVVDTFASGDFNSSPSPRVRITPDGALIGPFEDGGAEGGSVCYDGLNGQTLEDVDNLAYYANYTAENDTGGVGSPYLRVFFGPDSNNVEHDAIFTPNTQSPDPQIEEGPFHEWVATSGSWRYDDDPGDGPDMSYPELVADHGSENIAFMCISDGFSNGENLTSLLRWWQINGETFAFAGGDIVEAPAP